MLDRVGIHRRLIKKKTDNKLCEQILSGRRSFLALDSHSNSPLTRYSIVYKRDVHNTRLFGSECERSSDRICYKIIVKEILEDKYRNHIIIAFLLYVLFPTIQMVQFQY